MPLHRWRSLLPSRWSRPLWRIVDLAKQCTADGCRVSARVDGHEVWFESSDADLLPAVEAFIMPFLLPALGLKGTIATDHPVDPQWHDGLGRLLPIWDQWWGLGTCIPLALKGLAVGATARAAASALFFTAGVDSFHTLLFGPQVDALVYIEGFDVPLNDPDRRRHRLASIAEVGRSLGSRVVSVRTNLREHPIIAQADWEQIHGTALASVGYLLGQTAGVFRIASSDTGLYNEPWGSHQDTDRLFSTSRVAFEHWDENVHRPDKVRAIAGNPLVQNHLQVCWENLEPQGNCSRCEKCLRTMAHLHACGQLDGSRVFDSTGPWWKRLQEIRTLQGVEAAVYWVDLLSRDLGPELRAEIVSLLSR